MAVSACFGAPLLNNILGLGIALLISTSASYPEPFVVSPLKPSLYAAWAFLASGLILSLVCFHAYNYEPPRAFAYVLFVIYAAFMITSLVGELTS